MSHIHPVLDTDNLFVIDPLTRVIKAQSSKTSVVQYDHNSERFSFELPRFIEGHDMSACDKVEVHYLNAGQGKDEKASGVYEVDDLQEVEGEDKVTCSWLISAGATQYAGKLAFLLRFCCMEGETVTYVWNTAPFDRIHVTEGMNASTTVVLDYSDILEKWKAELFAAGYINAETLQRDIKNLREDLELRTNYVTPQMFGAKADGVTDDTDALQQALRASRFVYVPEGVYMIRTSTDDTAEYNDGEGIGVEVPSNTKLMLHTNAVLKGIPNKSSRYRVLWATGGENIHISGGQIECDKESATGEHGHGLVLRGCKHVVVEDVVIRNALADCILVSGDSSLADSKCEGIVIRGCELHGSRRQGITFGRSDGCLVDACYIHGVGGKDPQSGIDIEVDDPENQTATNIKINNCLFEDNAKYDIIVATYGIVEVVGCKCNGKIWNERGQLTVQNCIGSVYHYDNARSTEIFGSTVTELFSYGANCRCTGSVLHRVWTNKNVTLESCVVECEDVANGMQAYDAEAEIVANHSHIVVKNCNYAVNGNRAIFNACVFDLISGERTKMLAYLLYGEFNGCTFSLDTADKDVAYANGADARVKFLGCKFLTDFFLSINASSVKYLFVGNILCVEPSALLANETYVHDNIHAY